MTDEEARPRGCQGDDRPLFALRLGTVVLVVLAGFAGAAIVRPKPAPGALAQEAPAPTAASPLSVTYFDVGHGDLVWLRTSDYRDVLIDGGSKRQGEEVIRRLFRTKVKGLEAVVASHPDPDHIGGLEYVVRSRPVGRYIHNGQAPNSTASAELAAAVATMGVPTVVARAGMTESWGCCTHAEVIHPVDPLLPKDNDRSVVLRVTHGETELLFTGDIEKAAENQILGRRRDIGSNLLKVAHHGSAAASSQRFLDAVLPRLAVISVGKNGSGHPSPEVIDRLHGLGTVVQRTDSCGSVTVTSYGESWVAVSERCSVWMPVAAQRACP